MRKITKRQIFNSDLKAIYDKVEGFYYYCDEKGKRVSLSIFEEARNFKEGFGAVKMAGKWGFMGYPDFTKLAIPCVFDNCLDFIDGLAYVEVDGEKFYIDKNQDQYLTKVDYLFSKIDASNPLDVKLNVCDEFLLGDSIDVSFMDLKDLYIKKVKEAKTEKEWTNYCFLIDGLANAIVKRRIELKKLENDKLDKIKKMESISISNQKGES